MASGCMPEKRLTVGLAAIMAARRSAAASGLVTIRVAVWSWPLNDSGGAWEDDMV